MQSIDIKGLNTELEKTQDIDGFLGIGIVNKNGLLISSRLPRSINPRKFCAISATMFGAIEIAIGTLGNDQIDWFTVEYQDVQIIMAKVSDIMIVISLLDLNINLGLILIELEELIERLKTII